MSGEPRRFYPNPYITSRKQLSESTLLADCQRFLQESFPILENAISSSSGFLGSRSKKPSTSLYTGQVGIAMAIHRMDPGHQTKLNSKPRSPLSSGSIGLASDYLPFEMYHCWKLEKSLNLDSRIFDRSSESCDEVLYGKAGLATMVDYFAAKGMDLVNTNLVREILLSINMDSFPWSWHNKVYLGAAHGTTGILLALKRLGNMKYPEQFARLLSVGMLPSGNFKSSYDSRSDRLVQWCHGAAGFVPLLLEYRKDWQDTIKEVHAANLPSLEQLDRAIDGALNVLWERGLLTKGAGICHGIAGNGYCFLSHYHQNGNFQSLHRAKCFAQEILHSGASHCCEHADNPESLFEGLAGSVHFILDLMDAMSEGADSRIKLFDGMQIF